MKFGLNDVIIRCIKSSHSSEHKSNIIFPPEKDVNVFYLSENKQVCL